MKILTVLSVLVLSSLYTCSQGYVVNMNEETDHPAGRELFVSKCNSCHQLHNPHQFSEAEWDSLLVVMKRKAKINEEQRNEIFSWIMGIKNKRPVKTETIQK